MSQICSMLLGSLAFPFKGKEETSREGREGMKYLMSVLKQAHRYQKCIWLHLTANSTYCTLNKWILEMGACWPGSAAGDANKDWALSSFLLIILSTWAYLSLHGGNMAASAPSRK